MKRSPKFLLILIAILVFALTTAGSALADNHESDCMIPESGPWPPCATGGEATDQWNAGSMPSGDSDSADCMIPESGPWPACATGGAAAAGDADSDMGSDSDADSDMGSDSAGDMAASAGTTLLGSMQELEMLLEQMGGLLDRIHAGSAESCTEFMSYYLAIAALPVYENLPAEWVDLHNLYIDASVSALESNKDIFLLCENGGGTPSDLNYGVARTGVNASLDQIKAGIAVASEMADAPPAPPAEATPAPAEPTEEPTEPAPAEPTPTPEPAEPTPAPETNGLYTSADAQRIVREGDRVQNGGTQLECDVETDLGDGSANIEYCVYAVGNDVVGLYAGAMASADDAEAFQLELMLGLIFLDFVFAGDDTLCSADLIDDVAVCYRVVTENNMVLMGVSLSEADVTTAASLVNTLDLRVNR